MTTADKDFLLNFITRPAMFIHPLSADSAINFINGYEAGTGNTCDFTQQLRQVLSDKYGITYSSDGWPGQITRLAKKRASTWLILFRKTTLEIIVKAEGGRLSDNQQVMLKTRVFNLIERLEHTHLQQLSSFWIEDWLSMCHIQGGWFKQHWTTKEWTTIKKITKRLQAEIIFPLARV